MEPSSLIFVGVGALLMALAVPLMRRRVPPNPFYGLRVPPTFADTRVWYEANAKSGRDLLVLGAVVIGVALVWDPLGGSSWASTAAVCSGVAVGGALLLAVAGWSRAERMLRRQKPGAGG